MSNLGGYDRGIFIQLKPNENIKIPEGEKWFIKTKNIMVYDAKNLTSGNRDTDRHGSLLGDSAILCSTASSGEKSYIIGITFNDKSKKRIKYSHSVTIYLDIGEKIELKTQIAKSAFLNYPCINGERCQFSTTDVVLGDGVSLGLLSKGTINLQFFDVVE